MLRPRESIFAFRDAIALERISRKSGKVKSSARKLKKKSTSEKAPRSYDNSSRAQRVKADRQLIVQTMVQILVEKKGTEATFEEIAERTGISERTIYRFFKNKTELHRETNLYLTDYLKAGMDQIGSMDMASFAKHTFELFDRNEPLVLAYIYSSFGQEARKLFREKLNQAIIAKVRQEKPLELTPENLKKIAVIVSLVNAKIWHDIKVDFGFSGTQMGDSMAWAIRSLIDAL